jgi:hypothetical protein
MIFPTKVLVLAVFYGLPSLLKDSLWWWVVRRSEHAGLLFTSRRTILNLLIWRSRLLSTIVVHHRAAKGRPI